MGLLTELKLVKTYPRVNSVTFKKKRKPDLLINLVIAYFPMLDEI